MSKIIVIGSSNTDLAIKTIRIPEPGETVMGGTFMMTAGGKGANQAVAVARLGGDVAFVTKVGDDMFGDESRARYVKEGLPEKFLLVEKGTPSGVALITVDARGENCIVVAPGANNALTCADVDAVRDEIAAADYLLLQLEIPMEVVEHAAEVAVANGTKVILNPAPAAELSKTLIESLYLITPNRTECQLLSGVAIANEADAGAAAGKLMEMGVKNVIVTLGSKGSLVRTAEGCTVVEACRVESVDTTAAGDVFNGALCVALSEGKDLVEAARFASRASAISVTRMGAQSSVPYRAELGE
ncbi:MAG TPA: ribokinase [Candidatus Alistipes excrementipullorum]|nr:ribokinase [Candidatus Alistipes excrementipullorum]